MVGLQHPKATARNLMLVHSVAPFCQIIRDHHGPGQIRTTLVLQRDRNPKVGVSYYRAEKNPREPRLGGFAKH